MLPALPAFAAPQTGLPKDINGNDAITITRGIASRKWVAMTFDDGPHPKNTPQLLDILKARRIRATFYVIGWRVKAYPDIIRRMVAEGHEIGNHTYKHPNLAGLGQQSLLREIDSTNDIIYRTTGKMPVTMRPPYGALYQSQRSYVATNRRMPTILWSVDPADWRRPGVSVVANRIVGQAHPGAIVLAHDIHWPTIAAMPPALDALIKQGYGFTTVSRILGLKDWSKLKFTPRTS